jgi:ABC-type lipoprotein release transport system permease subunit
MGAIGLVLGVFAGSLLTLWFNINGFSYPGMETMAEQFNVPGRIYPSVSLLSALIGPLIVFIGTLLAALYPAARLHWLHPVEAMRAA